MNMTDPIRRVSVLSTGQVQMDLTRSLPRLDLPVVMVQGRLDQVAPGESAQQYASSLQAPGKQLIWFETSAHTPHLDEPAKFRDVMLRVSAAKSGRRCSACMARPGRPWHRRGAVW